MQCSSVKLSAFFQVNQHLVRSCPIEFPNAQLPIDGDAGGALYIIRQSSWDSRPQVVASATQVAAWERQRILDPYAHIDYTRPPHITRRGARRQTNGLSGLISQSEVFYRPVGPEEGRLR
jgi:hypothetical protein